MKNTIGIPRGLYYFQQHPFWLTFFKELGVPTVVSPPTNKHILDLGASRAVDGCCLPLKVYLGHVLTLLEQGVRTFFVPRIISVARREYICPYFLGLPDFIAHYLPPDAEVLSPVIDSRRSEWATFKNFFQLGSMFGDPLSAISAYRKARSAQSSWEAGSRSDMEPNRPKVLLLGHRYLLDDQFFTKRIRESLRESGMQVITPYQISDLATRQGAGKLSKRMFWTSGRQTLGALEHTVADVTGIVTCAAFACGTDSLVSDLVQRRARRGKVPNLLLYMDEHTGEAGMMTRLEAFLDMLMRRQTS